MKTTITSIFAGLVLVLSTTTSASVISDFDDSTLQGWTVSPSVGFSVSNPGSGGNGGGYLQLSDTSIGGSGGLAVAPLAFLGDLTGYASISWDSILPVNAFEPVRLIISSNTTEYVYTPASALPAGTWESWTANLDGATGWSKNFGSESFAQMLMNVSALSFDLEVSSSTSLEGGIDNVSLHPVPVPAALWLFGSGILVLAGRISASRSSRA